MTDLGVRSGWSLHFRRITELTSVVGTFLTICVMAPTMIVIMPKVSMVFQDWLYPKV